MVLGNPAAAKNGNRTYNTTNGVMSAYFCYDNGDQVVSASTGSTTYPMVTDGAGWSLPGHGNVTNVYGKLFQYDQADRNVNTFADTGGGNWVYTYQARDLAGRVVGRYGSGGTTELYGYTSESDTPALVLNSAGVVQDTIIGLPGGVTLTRKPAVPASTRWVYPNFHGDTLITTSTTGENALLIWPRRDRARC